MRHDECIARAALACVVQPALAMLLHLGRRAVSEDVADLLLECHGRIRRFLGMARSLANAPAGVTDDEIIAAAAQVRRYFTEGFPLHVEDEEVDIAPHISAAAAAQVRAEHDSHEHAVAALVEVCRVLERRPQALPERASALKWTVQELTDTLEAHLAFEESVVIPDLRRLDPARQQTIRDAMRARREREFARDLRVAR